MKFTGVLTFQFDEVGGFSFVARLKGNFPMAFAPQAEGIVVADYKGKYRNAADAIEKLQFPVRRIFEVAEEKEKEEG